MKSALIQISVFFLLSLAVSQSMVTAAVVTLLFGTIGLSCFAGLWFIGFR